MRLHSFIASSAMLLASLSSTAQNLKAGDILIDRAIARATMPGQTSGAAYLTLENTGKSFDKLLSVASPAAKSAEIHSMSMDGNVMKMREVPHIELKPADKIMMKPGDGYHIMLIGIHQPLKAGDKIPLTLTFEKAGKAQVSAIVEDNVAKAAKDKAAHQHHHDQHHKH
jgi:copper(I)-binding protein